MNRLKTFALYALGIIVFFIFSNFLIEVGLNSTYKDIEGKNNASEIEIIEAQATLVNGKISGKLNTNITEELYNKYIKLDLYSPRNVLLGTKYIEIKSLIKNTDKSFETYFKLQDVKYYNISIVDQKNEPETSEYFDQRLSRTAIMKGVIFALMCI